MLKKVARLVSKGKAIGWFQGRIIRTRALDADPRNNKIQKQLNLKIKFRESL